MKKTLRLVFIAFCISFAIMAALSLFALKQFSSLIENSEEVDDTYEFISKLYDLSNLTREVDIQERSYIITRDSNFLLQMEALIQQVIPATDALKKYTKRDKDQNDLLTLLRTDFVLKRDLIRQNITYLDTSNSHQPSKHFLKGMELRLHAEEYMTRMRANAHKTLEQRSKVKVYYQEVTFSAIRYLLTIFAFVTLILFFFMIREFKRRMVYQDELQLKIADLKRSHAELEQIAYAVSHDLQEPLRKIQIFSNRLLFLKKDNIDAESRATLERINVSASRMHDLIDDLMNLTSLVREERKDEVDLNEILTIVLGDLDERIAEKKAAIHTEALPVIAAHRRQIQLLFRSIIENALKFSKEEQTPVISIRCDRVSGTELIDHHISIPSEQHYYRITIADNGIGFEDKFINKMFQIFQSLHNKQSEYSGKGIGLAICQRVMVNHGGYILAHGRPNVGATFRLYFPLQG